jgi:6-phosphofructokinase 1
LKRRAESGRKYSIVVVAEDAQPHQKENFLTDEIRARIYNHERLGGIGSIIAQEIENRIGIEARTTKLGYVQRGGSPTPFDRILATRLGIKAYEMVKAKEWGKMSAIQGNKLVSVPLEVAVSNLKRLDEDIYKVAEVFFS